MMPSKKDTRRVDGGFVAMPLDVLDSDAYLGLSYSAKALLMEIARQYSRANNGRLLASENYLRERGWKSSDTITRAKRELIEAGFIHEMVKGHRPNKASWYAMTWYMLDEDDRFDAGTVESFELGAYRDSSPHGQMDRVERRQALYRKWDRQNDGLTPETGVGGNDVAPETGVAGDLIAPETGVGAADSVAPTAPDSEDHLDVPILETPLLGSARPKKPSPVRQAAPAKPRRSNVNPDPPAVAEVVEMEVPAHG